MRNLSLLLIIGVLLCSCTWDNNAYDMEYLPMDDSEYPYAGIPRLVIETDDFAQIRDRETKHPARLQIYGKSSPESEILELTVKGRGNSSFTGMPKSSMKIEFKDKQALFGMPKDRDWALIANSADKTLLKNFITYKLANWLGDDYSPRTRFVEVYLNREYLGVFLLTETVKVGKNRVNISKEGDGFLLERGPTEFGGEHFVSTEAGTTFGFKYPKEPTPSQKKTIRDALSKFENYILGKDHSKLDSFIDVEDYLRYYWVQELAKNLDGAFRRSIYFTWQKNDLIRLGPLWDFDVAYGNWTNDPELLRPDNWYINQAYWNKSILNDSATWERAKDFWNKYKSLWETIPDSIHKYANELAPATRNEFKRWPVLENTENWTYKEAYKSYDEAVDSLCSWIRQRSSWINKNL